MHRYQKERRLSHLPRIALALRGWFGTRRAQIVMMAALALGLSLLPLLVSGWRHAFVLAFMIGQLALFGQALWIGVSLDESRVERYMILEFELNGELSDLSYTEQLTVAAAAAAKGEIDVQAAISRANRSTIGCLASLALALMWNGLTLLIGNVGLWQYAGGLGLTLLCVPFVGWWWESVMPYYRRVPKYATLGTVVSQLIERSGPLAIEAAPKRAELTASADASSADEALVAVPA